jgi:hypothetical protein
MRSIAAMEDTHMKTREPKPQTKLQDLQPKKLSPQELEQIAGGRMALARTTCSGGCADDCGY